MSNKAKLKGSRPEVEPVTFTVQTNKTVLIEGERWNFTIHEDDFKKSYDVIPDDEPKE